MAALVLLIESDFAWRAIDIATVATADFASASTDVIAQFDAFTEDNDPYGDHTFGAFEFEIAGNSYKLFWKIDLYDRPYRYGSENPANTAETRRVLTIMQRHEY